MQKQLKVGRVKITSIGISISLNSFLVGKLQVKATK
jgi:hypothetical protein